MQEFYRNYMKILQKSVYFYRKNIVKRKVSSLMVRTSGNVEVLDAMRARNFWIAGPARRREKTQTVPWRHRDTTVPRWRPFWLSMNRLVPRVAAPTTTWSAGARGWSPRTEAICSSAPLKTIPAISIHPWLVLKLFINVWGCIWTTAPAWDPLRLGYTIALLGWIGGIPYGYSFFIHHLILTVYLFFFLSHLSYLSIQTPPGFKYLQVLSPSFHFSKFAICRKCENLAFVWLLKNSRASTTIITCVFGIFLYIQLGNFK